MIVALLYLIKWLYRDDQWLLDNKVEEAQYQNTVTLLSYAVVVLAVLCIVAFICFASVLPSYAEYSSYVGSPYHAAMAAKYATASWLTGVTFALLLV